MNTKLLAKGVPETIIRTLLGHSQRNSMTGSVYNSGLTYDVLAEALDKLSYPALDLDLLLRRCAELRA